jgi:hypothetical protein
MKQIFVHDTTSNALMGIKSMPEVPIAGDLLDIDGKFYKVKSRLFNLTQQTIHISVYETKTI